MRTEDTRDAGIVWWDESRGDGGAWVYRASGLGNCIGALVRARMGVDADDAPEWLQERWGEGRDLEEDILNRVSQDYTLLTPNQLHDKGYMVDDFGQVELTLKVPTKSGIVYVVCHPDGVLDEGIPVEAKAVSEGYAKTIKGNLPPFYQWQISVEAAGLGVGEVLFVTGIKEANEDRSEVTLGEVEMEMMMVPYTRADIIKRVMLVEKYAANDEVPFCDYAQYPCGYWTDHDPDDPLWQEKVEVEVPEEEVDAFQYAVDDYNTLHAAEKEIKAEKKAAAEKIAEFFNRWKAKGQRAKVGGWTVTDVVQVKKTVPTVELILKDKGIEMSEAELDEYRRTYEVRYPTIKGEREDG